MRICHPGEGILPVLQAARLDIERVQTHTDLMLTCRMGALYRMLTLLGLVLAFVVVASNGWAQFLVEGGEAIDKYTQYPFLGVDATQRNMLINAFNFQSRIFSMMSGAGQDSVEAFNILAMLGALVGALMLFFNAKIRKPMIIAPWLIVLILLVFAPYGSKLLFYPVSQQSLDTLFESLDNGAGGRESISPQDCVATPEACGFSPQIAGIHIASTLQMLFSDAFRSAGWKGLMEQARASKELKESRFMSIPEPVVQRLNDYAAQCEVPISSLVDSMGQPAAGGVTPSASEKAKPTEFLKEWNKILSSIETVDVDNAVPPAAIQLWGNQEFKDAKARNSWSNETQQLYVEGLAQIFRSLPGERRSISIDGCSSDCDGETSVSPDYALAKLQEARFFQVSEGVGGLLPGFFVYWSGATNKDEGNEGVLSAMNADTFPAANARKCYRSTGSGSIDTGVVSACVDQGEVETFSPSFHAGFIRNQLPTSFDAAPWSFLGELRDPNSPLSKMPVALRVYKQGELRSSVASPAVKDKIFDGITCRELGEYNIKSIVNLIVGPSGSANKATDQDEFSKVERMLLEPNNVPASDRVTLEDVCNNFREVPGTEGECGLDNGNGNGARAVTAIANNLAEIFDGVLTQNASSTAEEKRKLMLKAFLQHVEAASKFTRNTDPDVAKKADEDGAAPEVVGSRGLTWIGGGIASFLGQFIVGIGSLFVGPLAAAIIFFLTMLVDMSLMILIILTPFLLLAGLFVPGNAIGVLTVSIVGVFVLKFVPVTLIILNYLGAMIYAFIGFGAPPETASTMQSMIIIAMGGMYASLVTMTFFLLFKMGDASAILSRFTALDSSAKEVAQRGMAATIALATSAALLGAGTLGALAGRATMGMAARKAAANLGIPPGWIDAAQKGLTEVPNKDGKKSEGGNEQKTLEESGALSTVPTDGFTEEESGALSTVPMDGLTEEERAMRDAFDDQTGAKQDITTGDVLQKRGDATAVQEMARKRIDAAAAKNLAMGPAYGMTEAQANELIDNGSVTVDGKQYSLSETNGVYGISEGQGVSSIAGKSVGETTQAANQISGSETVAPVVAGEGAQAVAGIPTSVTIAGGSLDSITEVGRVQQATIEQTSMQERVAEKERDREAQEISAENKKYQDLADSGKLSAKGVDAIAKMQEATDPSQRAEYRKVADEDAAANRTSVTQNEREKLATRNMNDQIAEALGRFDAKNGVAYAAAEKKRKSGEPLTASEKELLDIRDGLANFDTAGVAQGEIMSRLGTFESLNAALNARAGADNLPSYKASALSGLYGAFSGAGGGLAKIPVLGPAISESLNEFYQAPERARAAQAVGGGMAWWTAQGNAKRMGFYQKEMAPLAAAQQYESMAAVGGFQAQADIARQAASEAVAKSRSQWEAMVASRAPTLSMDLRNEIMADNTRKGITMSQNEFAEELSRRFNEKVNSPEFKVVMTPGELSGLGRMDAADKIASVRQEAYLMQGAALQVKRVKGGLDGNMMLKVGTTEGFNVETEEVGVILTPEALARVRGDLTTKAATKKYDDMMITHYGLTEKQYLRGDAQWDFSRNMNTSAAAAAMFSRKDISTDYLVGGHLHMVSGKERFLEGKAQYETLVKFRNETNNKIAEYVQNQLASAGGAVSSLLDKAGATSKVSKLTGQDYSVNARLELEKWAGKKMMENKEYLPLNLIFESATTRGRSSYELKAQKARSEMAAENAAVWEAVDKARRSALSSAMGRMHPSAKKAAKVDVNGFIAEATAPLEVWTEMIDTALGTASEAIHDKLAKFVGSDPKRQEALFQSTKQSFKDKDGKVIGKEVASYMDGKMFNEFLKNELNAQQRAAIESMKGRYYRERNGRIEFGYTRMKNDGTIEDEF